MRLKPEFKIKKNDLRKYEINVPLADGQEKRIFDNVQHVSAFKNSAAKVLNNTYNAILFNYPLINEVFVNLYIKKDSTQYLSDFNKLEIICNALYFKKKSIIHNRDFYNCVNDLKALINNQIETLNALRPEFVKFSDAYFIRKIDTVLYALDEYKSLLNIW